MIEVLLINCTRISKNEIKEILKLGPFEAKKKTAIEIIRIVFSVKEAQKAEENFIKAFQKKEIPTEIEEIKTESGELLGDVLVKNSVLSSKGVWKRLVGEKAVHDLNEKQNINDFNLKVSKDLTLKIGKKRFVKVTIK
jgi:tyrosyl-tRNA synthetase